jgi:hypothetical protein
MPRYIIRRELKNISDQTTTALTALIPNSENNENDFKNLNQQSNMNIQQQRAVMAQTQAKLVEKLEMAVGHDEAVKQGREALFLVGQNLGKQIRGKLGVGNNKKDLIKAAKILYQILGIEFYLEWRDNSNAEAVIDRCALSEHYSKLTCEVLSATDEGVMKGLQPNVTMRFQEYITANCRHCVANIHFNEKGQTQ